MLRHTHKIKRIIFDPYVLILPGSIILLWLTVTVFHITSPRIIPPPWTVGQTLVDLFRHEHLLQALLLSIVRVFQGFFIGGFLGFLFGSLLGLSPKAEQLFAPLFHAVRQVPFVGWIPLIIVWCGTGDNARITFIALGAFTPMVLNTYTGITGVPRQYIELGNAYMLRPLQLFFRIILPAALPSILTGVVLSFNMSWILLIAAEMMITTHQGLGCLIADARELFRMDIVFAGILVIATVTLFLNKIIEVWQRHILLRFVKENSRGGQ
jgi:sulfonate transport system permease protein